MKLFSGFSSSKVNPELTKAINEGAVLIDVRSPGEFASGSVPGAINIPVDTLQNRLRTLDGSRKIVVFCRSGNRSGMAKNILEQNGFKNVIDGGALQQMQTFFR